MRAHRVVLLALVLSAGATPAAAGLLPSFHLDGCTWGATHIVVVTEGETIDGAVEVLESWKGDLKPGDRVTVPELAAYAPEKARTIADGPFAKPAAGPVRVTCSRMVLFLIRKPGTAEAGKPAPPTWLPADQLWKEMQVSIAWVEDDKVFAFQQWINPGPTELVSLGINECGLKCQVDDILAAQAALTEAIRSGKPAALTAAVPPLLRSDSEYVRHVVIGTLGTAGANALPALRLVLKDEAFLKYHADAIHSLSRAGGAAVGPELAEVARQELAYWKKAGPGLPRGWWNGGGVKWEEVNRLRDHYLRASAAITGLGDVRHAGGRAVVVEFRDYWRSLPQLKEIAQLAEACDETLGKLRP